MPACAGPTYRCALRESSRSNITRILHRFSILTGKKIEEEKGGVQQSTVTCNTRLLETRSVPDAEGFNVHRRQNRSIRLGVDVEVRRSRQAVACRKRNVVEPGKPQGFLVEVKRRNWQGWDT